MSRPWQQRFFDWLGGRLPTLLLAGGLVFLLSLSVRQAEWVADSSAIVSLLFLGFIIGWMLAASCWPAWFVLVYSLLMGAALAVQYLGRIVWLDGKTLSSPFFEQVVGMHLHLVAFQLRLGGWLGTLSGDGAIRDTGLFLLLLSLAGWGASVWLMWWMVRRKQALPGILPLFSLMAVNVHLSRQPRSTLLIFAALTILTILLSAFKEQKTDWARRHVDYSEELGIEWGLVGGLLSTVIVVFALVFSLVATPDGWHMLSDMVEKSRQQMSDTANQLFGGVKPPPPLADETPLKPPAVVNTPDLGEIGLPISEGDQTIFYAWVSDPPPLPENLGGRQYDAGSVPRHYWRSAVFGDYTGRGWLPAAMAVGAAAADPQPLPAAGRYVLKQRYEIEARHQETLFAVNEPVFSTNGTILRQTLADGSRLVEGRTPTYEVTSLATDVTVRALEQAGTNYSADIRAQYLQLPSTLPSRVRSLADEIVAGEVSPYGKADNIQQYLRGNYAYKLDVPLPPAGRDVVDYFLFDAPGGFCTYFASAMVVLLRIEGVPARVSSGYAMGIFDTQRGMYRVPASASHAWVEVYFPGLGWVEFEPTAVYAEFAYPLGLAAGSGPQPQPIQRVVLPEPKKLNQLLWLLVPVGLVALLWGFYFWYKIEKNRLADPALLAVKLYKRVRGGLAFAGIQAGPYLTAFEFADGAGAVLENYPRLLEVLERSTVLFVESIYTGRVPDVEDVTEGEWMWRQARGELISLALRARLKPK